MKQIEILIILTLIVSSCKNNGKEYLHSITKDSITVNYSGNLCSNDINEIIDIINGQKDSIENLQVPLNDLKNIKIIGSNCEINLYPVVKEFKYDTTDYVFAYTNIRNFIEKDFKNRKVNIFITNQNQDEIINVNKEGLTIEYADTVIYEYPDCQIFYHKKQMSYILPKQLYTYLKVRQPYLFSHGKILKVSIFGKDNYDVKIYLSSPIAIDTIDTSFKKGDPLDCYFLFDSKKSVINIISEDGNTILYSLLVNRGSE